MIVLSLILIFGAIAIYYITVLKVKNTYTSTHLQNTTSSSDILSVVQLPATDVSTMEVKRYIVISINDTEIMLKDISTNEKIPYAIGQDILISDSKGQSRNVSWLDTSYLYKEVTVLTDKKNGKTNLVVPEN